MSENIIKFGKARKALARAEKDKRARENRIRFGRTKAEKNADKAKTAQFERSVDSHKRSTRKTDDTSGKT